MGLVVSFAGRIGSGKSSVTAALADVLGWRRAAFGDYLRAEVTRRGGDPESRETLQDLGQSLVDNEPEAFCRALLESTGFRSGEDLLVDGVRHVDIQRMIRDLVAPSETRLIYLLADISTRVHRVSNRPQGREDFSRAEQHCVEAELAEALPSNADVVMEAHDDLAQLVDRCRELIVGWGRTSPESAFDVAPRQACPR